MCLLSASSSVGPSFVWPVVNGPFFCVLVCAIDRLEDYYAVDCERSLLGEGSFGVVYRCVCKRTGEPRACKIISKSKVTSAALAQLLVNEIRLHSSLDHINTVPLYETLQSETDIFAIMGVAGDFELVDYVADKRQVCTPKPLGQFAVVVHLKCGALPRAIKSCGALCEGVVGCGGTASSTIDLLSSRNFASTSLPNGPGSFLSLSSGNPSNL